MSKIWDLFQPWVVFMMDMCHLLKSQKKKCSMTIVSIFVNPTQFNNRKDYNSYPRNLKKDLNILKKLKVDFLYIPKNKDIYSQQKSPKIKLSKKDIILCAKFRKGHFEGVIDVMNRLTKIIKPGKIFMGEKDFQQLFLIKKYISSVNKNRIIKCKTIRNVNKLPLSSRNKLLNKKSLTNAAKLSKDLFSLKKNLKNRNRIQNFLNKKKIEFMKNYDVKIEYLELRNKINLKISNKVKNSKLFIAYYVNKIRLIDNI